MREDEGEFQRGGEVQVQVDSLDSRYRVSRSFISSTLKVTTVTTKQTQKGTFFTIAQYQISKSRGKRRTSASSHVILSPEIRDHSENISKSNACQPLEMRVVIFRDDD
jgi:hypothetical protein